MTAEALLFPAHAGVILFLRLLYGGGGPVPRTRGGDPFVTVYTLPKRDCSPHTRG